MHNRIKQLRKSLNLNQAEFGDRIGVKQAAIAAYEKGTRTPLDAVLLAICREYGINETWLRTGEGEMYAELPEDDLVKRTTELLGAHDPLFETFVYMYSELSPESRAALLKKGAELFNDALRRQKDKE